VFRLNAQEELTTRLQDCACVLRYNLSVKDMFAMVAKRHVQYVFARLCLALNNVAAAEPSELNVDSAHIDIADAPGVTFRVAEHHASVGVPDRASEGLKIVERMSTHEILPASAIFAETA
jgi:hypothetical protein